MFPLTSYVSPFGLCNRSQQKRKSIKPKLTIPDGGGEEDVVVEEGLEVEWKTPLVRNGSEPLSPKQESEIQEILDRGSDVGDDEIEEATKRLLACTLLQNEIDDIWEKSDSEGGHHDDDQRSDVEAPDEHDAENGDDNNANTSFSEAGGSSGPTGYGSSDTTDSFPREEPMNEDDAPPNEMTSLLGNKASGSATSMASHNEEILRPSIFTTVSEIDSKRRQGLGESSA